MEWVFVRNLCLTVGFIDYLNWVQFCIEIHFPKAGFRKDLQSQKYGELLLPI